MKCPDIKIQAFLDAEALTNLMFDTQHLSDSFYDVENYKEEYDKQNYLTVLNEFETIYLRKARASEALALIRGS